MPKFAGFVMGPSGCGKSTFCAVMSEHGIVSKTRVKIVNLDPGADKFNYDLYADIRDLISVEDTMEAEDLALGPNGGLVFAIEYLAKNLDWLSDQLGDEEDDFFLFDCPGQLDLFTDSSAFRDIVSYLQQHDYRVGAINVLDATFLVDTYKFLAGSLLSLITLLSVEVPHISIINKMDLISPQAKKTIDKFLDPDYELLVDEDETLLVEENPWSRKMPRFIKTLTDILTNYNMVNHIALDISKDDSVQDAFQSIISLLQINEVGDVRTRDFEERERSEISDVD